MILFVCLVHCDLTSAALPASPARIGSELTAGSCELAKQYGLQDETLRLCVGRSKAEVFWGGILKGG